MQTTGNAIRNAFRTSATRLCARALLPLTLSALTLGGIVSPRTAAAQVYSVEDLGILSKGTYSQAVGNTNLFNTVIGQGDTSGADHAFFNTGGGNVDLGVPTGFLINFTSSHPTAISGINIAGFASGNGTLQACWWPGGNAAQLLPMPFTATRSVANGINGSGVIVGWVYFPGLQASNAYMWDKNNGYWFLGWGLLGGAGSGAAAINDNGWIVGSAFNAAGHNHAYLWIKGVVTDLHQGGFGLDWSDAYALNNGGMVVGRAYTAGGSAHAFLNYKPLFQNRVLLDLKTLVGYTNSEAYSINAAGKIVGWSGNQFGVDGHAFYYDGKLKDLNSMLDASGAGWTLVSANGINDNGQIVGYGLHFGQKRAFRLTPH